MRCGRAPTLRQWRVSIPRPSRRRRKAASTNPAAPRPRRRRRAPRIHVPGPQRRSAAPGAGLLGSRLPRRRGREPSGTLGSAFRRPIACVASPVEAAGWRQRIVWIGGAATDAQEPDPLPSTSRPRSQRERNQISKFLDQTLRMNRRDERRRTRERESGHELHISFVTAISSKAMSGFLAILTTPPLHGISAASRKTEKRHA